MDEHPVLKLHHERLVPETEVVIRRSHRKALLRSLDGVGTLVELRVERQDVDDERAVLVKPGLLLNHNRVLILHPGLKDGAAVIDGVTPRPVLVFHKSDEDSAHCAAVYAEVRHVDFQLLTGMVVCVGGVESELGIQDHVVGSLIILELDLAGTEVISYTVEHSVSD
jgi:hypothetical protein